jgi:hypothetical protein
MVDHDVLADLGSLTDDHAHAVVDEEAPADGGSGMDLNACQETAKLAHQARGEAQAGGLPQMMCQPVNPDGMEP